MGKVMTFNGPWRISRTSPGVLCDGQIETGFAGTGSDTGKAMGK